MASLLLVVLSLIAGGALSALGAKPIDALFDRIKTYGWRFWQRPSSEFSGTWYAAWSTTAQGIPNVNVDTVEIEQSGKRVLMHNLVRSIENPIGSYLWKAQLTLTTGGELYGPYVPAEDRVSSKGVMYFVKNPSGHWFEGGWVGSNIDSDNAHGFGVIAETADMARSILHKLLKQQASSREVASKPGLLATTDLESSELNGRTSLDIRMEPEDKP